MYSKKIKYTQNYTVNPQKLQYVSCEIGIDRANCDTSAKSRLLMINEVDDESDAEINITRNRFMATKSHYDKLNAQLVTVAIAR